jgi:hypothetical protein
LEAPCANYEVPIKYVLKDCRLLKSFVAGTLQKKAVDALKKAPQDPNDNDEVARYPSEEHRPNQQSAKRS